MDFAGLKSAVNRWSERDYDDADLNEFIELAEARIRRNLTGYQREVTSVINADSNGVFPLPTDFTGMRWISYQDRPYRWSISGQNATVIDGAGYALDVTYFGVLPALSNTNTTNWLLTAAPDVYLWLVKAQAREFNEEWEAAAGLEAKGLSALADLNLQSTVAQYSRAGLQLPVHD
ncbi:MAG TPA: hypothetical protein VMA55_15695 [Acidovorax sp.]|nr:hypothetical protein [Acidovorax sp.]